MFRNKRIKELEEQLKAMDSLHDMAVEIGNRRVEELIAASETIGELKAELAELEEENEKLFEEITELKAKYTAEVQKNFELVQKIDMLEG